MNNFQQPKSIQKSTNININDVGIWYYDLDGNGKKGKLIYYFPKMVFKGIKKIIVIVSARDFFQGLTLFKSVVSNTPMSALKRSDVLYNAYRKYTAHQWIPEMLDQMLNKDELSILQTDKFHLEAHTMIIRKEKGWYYDLDSIIVFGTRHIKQHPALTTPVFERDFSNTKYSNARYYKNTDNRVLYKEVAAPIKQDKNRVYSVLQERSEVGDVNESSASSPKIHIHTVDETFIYNQYDVKAEVEYKTDPKTGNLKESLKKQPEEPKTYSAKPKDEAYKLTLAGPSGADWSNPSTVPLLYEQPNLIIEAAEGKDGRINPKLVIYKLKENNVKFEIHIPIEIPMQQ